MWEMCILLERKDEDVSVPKNGVCTGVAVADAHAHAYAMDKRHISGWIDSLCKTIEGSDMSWPAYPNVPIGSYPLHWSDGVHD